MLEPRPGAESDCRVRSHSHTALAPLPKSLQNRTPVRFLQTLGHLLTFDRLQTLIGGFIVQHLSHPRALVVAAWLWLAAKSRATEEKRRSLNAVLQLDPENQPLSLALLVLDQRRPTNYTISHDRLRASSIGARIRLRPC
jgi:hypothetical protein